jgi:diaminohydroxyphosphoribosylaminopyrimidine deaminase / 5-amino-6-(5-phosphoribosylamino)uracil reductase
VTPEQDRYYMHLALKEARKGLGRTSPNPCVGSVIVKNNYIISRGYHRKAGEPHAEINALRKAGKEAVGSTIYITLEPCNHTGRTPPCSHALVDAGVKRVVVGMEDPNPLVQGSGIGYLLQRGIEVVSGVLAEECREINRPFLKHITTAMPWVVMKAGVSLDGRITYKKGKSGWITGPESTAMVHRLRDLSDAIMVGINTICIDNPSLTTRLPQKRGKDPVRVILDTNLRIPLTARVLHLESEAPTWIFCRKEANPGKRKELAARGVAVRAVAKNEKRGLDLKSILKALGSEGITSVLVEGGAEIHGSMLRERLVDRVHLFYAPIFAGDGGVSVVEGIKASSRNEAICLEKIRYKRCGDDMMIEGDVCYR